MALVETRITRTSQPQDASCFASSSGIPSPIEIWLPATSPRGLVNAYEPSVEASFVTQPNTGGKGIRVTATGRRYAQQNILNASTHRAWVVVAYRNFGGGGTQSIVRKDGALTPLQESSGVVNAAHFFSGVGLRITKYPGSETVNLEGRVNVFTGYGDSSDCFIALNHGDEASVGAGGPSLNSTTNPLVFGSAENGGEVASSWVIMAVGLWQGVSTSSIPTRKQLKSFRENPWQIFEPEVSRIWVDDYVSAGGGATTVTTDASTSYAIRAAITSDAAASYPVRSATSSDATAAYPLRAATQSDTAAAYAIRSAASADALASYYVLGLVQTDTAGSYAVRAAAQSDALASYAVRSAVQSDALASYEILSAGVVVSDSPASYSIRSAVQADGAASYPVRSVAQSDAGGAYAVRAAVLSDVGASYAVQGALVAVWADATASYFVDGVVSTHTPGAQTRPSRLQSSSRPSRLQTGTRASR